MHEAQLYGSTEPNQNLNSPGQHGSAMPWPSYLSPLSSMSLRGREDAGGWWMKRA